MIRHATLGAEDLVLALQGRGDANQLGFALALVRLRHPARALEANEAPPPALLAYLARQLDVDPGAFAIYVRRDQTCWTHLAELTRRLGMLTFNRAPFAPWWPGRCHSHPRCATRKQLRHCSSRNCGSATSCCHRWQCWNRSYARHSAGPRRSSTARSPKGFRSGYSSQRLVGEATRMTAQHLAEAAAPRRLDSYLYAVSMSHGR